MKTQSNRLICAAVLAALTTGWSCSDSSPCSVCAEDEIDPSQLVDPYTLGDGSGFPGEDWTRVPEPGVLGWSEARLVAASELANQMGSDAFTVVDRGVLVWDFGRTSNNYIVQSCRKSFLSALYGIFVEDGTIDMGLTMGELGIDDLPPSLTEVEKQATLENLILARSGIYHEAAAESQSMKNARPERGSHAPGTFWYYNNWDFNVLGTAFIELTGEDIFESIHQRFAVPLQMQEFLPPNGWYYYQDMSEHPAYHFQMSARDMARFGLLFAREGEWRGEQIIPADWVEVSTQPHSDAGTVFDYGYMWWVGKPGYWGDYDLFAALGGSGQAIFVFPELDIVITHKVDYDTWRSDWAGVYQLVKQILYAKVL